MWVYKSLVLPEVHGVVGKITFNLFYGYIMQHCSTSNSVLCEKNFFFSLSLISWYSRNSEDMFLFCFRSVPMSADIRVVMFASDLATLKEGTNVYY